MTDGLSDAFNNIKPGYTLVPPPWADRLRVVSIKLPMSLIELLDEIADNEGKYRSEIIKEAIERYVREYFSLLEDPVPF